MKPREVIEYIIILKVKEGLLYLYRKKDLPKGTLMEVLKQAGISKEELK